MMGKLWRPKRGLGWMWRVSVRYPLLTTLRVELARGVASKTGSILTN